MAGDYFEMVLTMLLCGTTVDYFEEVFTERASTAKPVKTDVAVGARVAWHCTVVQRLHVTAIVAIGL